MGDVRDEVCLQTFCFHLLVHGLTEAGGDPPGITVDRKDDDHDTECRQEGPQALRLEKVDEEGCHHAGSQQIRQHEEHIGKHLRGGLLGRMDIMLDETGDTLQQRIGPETSCLKAANDRERQRDRYEVICEEADTVLPEAPVIDDAEDVFERTKEHRRHEEGDQSPEGTDQHPKLDRQMIE